MDSVFNKEKVNLNRQKEIDLTKTVAIFFLVLVHVSLFIGFSNSNPLAETLDLLSTLFGASTFMVLMGFGISYKNDHPNKIIKRGFKILFLGYLFNAIFSIFPLFIYHAYDSQEITSNDVIFYLLNDDIMQFAGLALIFYGLLKKIKLNDFFILGIAIAISTAMNFVRPITTSSSIANQIIGLFITSKSGSSLLSNFPLCEWFIFVPLGAIFGNVLKHVQNKTKFYLILYISSLLLILGYLIPGVIFRVGIFDGEYSTFTHLATYNALYMFVCALYFIATSYFHSLFVKGKFLQLVTWMSKYLNSFYVISYLVIVVSKTILLMNNVNIRVGLPIYGVLIYYVATLVLTFGFVCLYSFIKSKVINYLNAKKSENIK